MIIIHKKTSTESVLSSSIHIASHYIAISISNIVYIIQFVCSYGITSYLALQWINLALTYMDIKKVRDATTHTYRPFAYVVRLVWVHTAVETDSIVRHSRTYHRQCDKTTGSC